MKEYGFVENIDYTSFLENSKKPQGGRPSKEYVITLNMAKELSMIERTEKGKQAITNCDRPYTLTLKGCIGHDSFYADLEGVCLNIKSSHPLTNKQVSKLENKLQETFPVPLNGKFEQDEVDEIVKRSSIVFRV